MRILLNYQPHCHGQTKYKNDSLPVKYQMQKSFVFSLNKLFIRLLILTSLSKTRVNKDIKLIGNSNITCAFCGKRDRTFIPNCLQFYFPSTVRFQVPLDLNNFPNLRSLWVKKRLKEPNWNHVWNFHGQIQIILTFYYLKF